jgi:hypothetical protein
VRASRRTRGDPAHRADAARSFLGENLIRIPPGERRRTEAAIEELANLYVSHHCRRTIASPNPCVYLSPEDAAERRWLEALIAVRVEMASRPPTRSGKRHGGDDPLTAGGFACRGRAVEGESHRPARRLRSPATQEGAAAIAGGERNRRIDPGRIASKSPGSHRTTSCSIRCGSARNWRRQTGAFILRRTKLTRDGNDHDPAWITLEV